MELAHKLFSTRTGTLVLAGVAAVLATVAVLVYLSNYRSSVKAGGQPATVLVAASTIAKGTPGNLVATKHLFQAQTMRESQLREGALSDPASLRGRVATTDIYRGQQLTAADFAAAPSTTASKLISGQRAITVPLDSAHGMIGELHTGDRVDIYAGFNVEPVDNLGRPLGGGQARPVLRLIMANVPVLDIEKKDTKLSSAASSRVTLRVRGDQPARLAFASDNGKVWLVLRPPTGARPTPPAPVSVETLLLGTPPIQVIKSLGGRR